MKDMGSIAAPLEAVYTARLSAALIEIIYRAGILA
jgi:hypothetical protein